MHHDASYATLSNTRFYYNVTATNACLNAAPTLAPVSHYYSLFSWSLQDALPYLWKVYKDIMPTLDGVYILVYY